MSLRARLLAMFVVIILMVSVTMGFYSFRLIEAFFQQAASAELRSFGPGVQQLMEQNSLLLSTPVGVTVVTSYIASTTRSRVLLTDASGVIIADTNGGGQTLVGQTVPSTLLSSTLHQGHISTFSYSQAGQDSFAVSVPWVNLGRVVGSILMIRQVETSARQTALQVNGYAVRAGLLASAVAMVAAYFMSKSITDPLRKMSHAARAISKGNFSDRLEIRAEDELGDLAEAMNTMSSEISSLIGNLTEEKEKLQAVMDQRTELLSNVSHDLRTPVTSIRGFVEALRDGVITDEAEKAHTLNIIHEESERLSRLVDDLFYLARLEAGEAPTEISEVDLAAIVQGTVETMSPLSREKELDVAVHVDEEAAAKGFFKVTGSADRLTRAILNILDNAVKYSPHGGAITVAVTAKPFESVEQLHVPSTYRGAAGPVDAKFTSSTRSAPGAQSTSAAQSASGDRRANPTAVASRENGSARPLAGVVSISDQGPGISEEDIARIFERFYRGDKARSRTKSGAGLGLSIARFIVEQHNGTMWVDSVLGQGSTFHIALPLASDPTAPLP